MDAELEQARRRVAQLEQQLALAGQALEDFTYSVSHDLRASLRHVTSYLKIVREDLGDGRSIEFSLLRLDQNDVQMPGYVFDIDSLVTDGYNCDYIDENCSFGDRFESDLSQHQKHRK